MKEILPALFIFIMLTLLQFSGYKVTDDGFLKAYNVRILVSDIHKLVYQKDRVDVYYTQENEKIHVSAFFPKDKTGFVEKLKSINPNIQVV